MSLPDRDDADWRRWQAARRAELAAPDSWLGLVGLHWLDAGDNAVGSAADCVVRLPRGPARLGVLQVVGSAVAWIPADPGEPPAQDVRTDAEKEPSVLWYDRMQFFVIVRDGRLAVRVRDLDWALQRPFAGLDYFPFRSEWVVHARWETLDTPLSVEVPTMTGDMRAVTVGQRAIFSLMGQAMALLPLEVGAERISFVFRDLTGGSETYGGGRFLHAKPPVGGRVILDFNRAFNPPCAFSPFATCPLPPPENWLAVAVRAGEKRYSGGH